MHAHRRRIRAIDSPRRGLAPLELVLALPLMLFVMALMVNIGSIGAWKVRTQANVRNASWRTMHLRTGGSNPNPPMWPTAAQLRGGSGSDAAETDAVWNAHPDLLTEAMRGDSVVEPFNGNSIRVNRKLEIDEGVHDGGAPLERRIPMLRGILPDNGRYNFDVEQNVLDGAWEFHQMGYSWNRDRRIRLLYEIEREDFPSVLQLKNQLDAGPMQTLVSFPLAGNLAPLDADPDLYRLSTLPPRGGQTQQPVPGVGSPPANPGYSPDFYPWRRLGDTCLADPTALRTSSRYTSFLQQIRRLPGRMGREFRRWYQDRLDYLQQQNPPIAGSQSEMQQLQDDINKLDQFLGALPPQHR